MTESGFAQTPAFAQLGRFVTSHVLTTLPAKPSSLGVIFLTLYIDLIGFSIFFPVGPAMLEWYVNKESEGGLLSTLVRHLQALAHAAHASDLATGALFAGALGSVYSLMQFVPSPRSGAPAPTASAAGRCCSSPSPATP